MNEFICKYCGKECKNSNSLRNHERFCKSNPDRQESPFVKYNKTKGDVWNKGLTAETDERVKKYKETYRRRFENGEIRIIGKPHTEEFKKRQSILAKQRNLGGHYTSKTIEFNGIKLDSSYEYILAQSLSENNIQWQRPSYFIWEDDKHILHRYYPDFYLPDFDVYLDPKNDYLLNNVNPRFGITDIEKIEKVQLQNNIKIFILNKDELTWDVIKEKIKK
jgi:hypothetical protein